ncbi:MAG: hypothetical protein ACLPZM_05860 [Thermoplasmata archaeon]
MPAGPEPSLLETLDADDLGDRDGLINRWSAVALFGAILVVATAIDTNLFTFTQYFGFLSGTVGGGFLLETYGVCVLLFLVVPLYAWYGEERALAAGVAALLLIVAGALLNRGVVTSWVLTSSALVSLGGFALVVGLVNTYHYTRPTKSAGLPARVATRKLGS